MNLDRAKRKYEEFTGSKPRRVARISLDDEDIAAYKLGRAVGVAYEATRDGKKAQYFHKFKPSVRPDLVVRDDGKKLYFSGGRYTVTDRGIEDMPYAFVVNPSPRTGRRPKKRRLSPMARTVRRRRRRAVTTYARNPAPIRRRRRTRRRMTAVTTTFRRNPIRRRRRVSVHRRRRVGYRRNPIGAIGGMSLPSMLFPAVMIGAGAVGSELIMGYLPLPANLKTGMMRHLTKGAVGVAGGMAISKFLRQRKLGEAFALGALVIASHDAIKELILQFRPGTNFGMHMYMPSRRMGSFGDGGDNAFGYVNPAQLTSRGNMGMYVPFSPGQFNGAAGGFATDATAGVGDYSGV